MQQVFKRKIGVVTVLVLIVLLGLVFGINITDVSAEEVSSTDNIIEMDEDVFFYQGSTYALGNYESLKGNTREVVQSGVTTTLAVTGDDAIVSLIPKEQFLNDGSHFVIGKEWGYYIKTITDYSDPFGDPDHISGNKRSFVTIFDLSQTFDGITGEVRTSVAPLYQYEYVALSPEENIMVIPQKDDYAASSYTGRIQYELASNTALVVPCVLSERCRYYLKDISFSMSLYNEQAPNQINGGNIYNAQQDNGAYFTYMDYEYDGIVRKNKEFPVDSFVSLAKTEVNFIIGFLKDIPYYGKGFKLASTIMDTADLINSFKSRYEILNYLQDPVIYDTVEKHITSQNFNANRDEQIRNYGGLLKNMGVVINTDSEGQSIWYGKGNCAAGLFKITDTALNGALHNFTRLIREIGIKIVDVENDTVVDAECTEDSFALFSPVYSPVDAERSNDIFILPEGKNFFRFVPVYSGAYSVNCSNENLQVIVEDSSGNPVEGSDVYHLNRNQVYNLIFHSNVFGSVDSFSIHIASENSSGTLIGLDKRIVKKSVGQGGMYTLTTQSEDVEIEDVLVVNEGRLSSYSPFDTYVPASTLSVPFSPNDYYIVLRNKVDSVSSYELEINDCASGTLGEQNAVAFDGNNFSYIKIGSLNSGDYTISLANTDKVQYKIYDSDLKPLTTSLFGAGLCTVHVNGGVIYIGAKTDIAKTENIIINKNDTAFVWKINDTIPPDRTVELERGKSYRIQFFINGVEQGTDIRSDDPLSKYNYTLADGILKIEDYCIVDGSYFTLKYAYSDQASYNAELYIIPVFVPSFNGIQSVVNDETLKFAWEKTEGLYEISYSISKGNESFVYSISTVNQEISSVYYEDITDKVDAFVSKIGYVTVKIYQIKIQTSQTIESYDFDSEVTVDGSYGGGTGIWNDPYLISCSRHFYNIEDNISNFTYFKINEVLEITGEGIDHFYGVLEGSDICYVWDADVRNEGGLIIHNYGTIQNLRVRASVTYTAASTNNYLIGGMVCYNENTGYIRKCSSIFTGNRFEFVGCAGGLVGVNRGTIEDCWASVQLTTPGGFGGIAGDNYGTIKSCRTTGTVNQRIIKYDDSYENSSVGGIVAYNYGNVQYCNAGTDVDAYLYINIIANSTTDLSLAPYAGPIYGKMMTGGSIVNCKKIGFSLNKGNLNAWQVRNINNDFGS